MITDDSHMHRYMKLMYFFVFFFIFNFVAFRLIYVFIRKFTAILYRNIMVAVLSVFICASS